MIFSFRYKKFISELFLCLVGLIKAVFFDYAFILTPTDNAAMEAINGWIKEELFNDFKIKDQENVEALVDEYINFFNSLRPSFSLNYLTPKQFKEKYAPQYK